MIRRAGWPVIALVAAVLLLAACGSDDEAADVASDDSGQSNDGGGSGDGGSGGDADGGSDGDGDGDSNGGSDGDGPDDEDAAEIVGNPDLDLEELAENAPELAEALDEIDDLVSIGECRSETVGLAMDYVPDGWQCRVLDEVAAGGLDGFSLFEPGTTGGIEITIGTRGPFGAPCEILQMCDQAQPIELSDNFDTDIVELVGIPIVFGTHVEVEADLSITTTTPLDDDDRAFIAMVLDNVVRI